MSRALIVVDVQNDFCEGGSLPVAGGSRVAQKIADHIRGIGDMGSHYYDYIVATRDHHSRDSDNDGHFGNPPDYVDSWPAHCVESTKGSSFHPDIKEVEGFFDAVFYKGMGVPAYSGFEGFVGMYVYLHEWLQERGVTDLTIVGIAADYCVKATALDGIKLGYNVRVPSQLTVAVGGDTAKVDAIVDINIAQNKRNTKVN